MKILAVNPAGCLGGAERSLLDVIHGLQQRGHSIRLAAPPGGLLEEAARQSAIEFESWNLPASFRSLGRHSSFRQQAITVPAVFAGAWSLVRITRALEPDVIYSNGVKSHMITGSLVRLLGVPVVWHVRDFVRRRRGLALLLLALHRLASIRVIAISRAVAAEWTFGSAVDIVHNGFRLPPASAINRQSRPGVPIRLLTAGVLAPWKGTDRVLTACAGLDFDWRLTVCGDEIYETAGHIGERARLEQMACKLGISRRVRFAGEVRDIGSYYRDCDIFIHASVEPEPFGRVVAEAMSYQAPVIATRGGGVPEILSDGVEGVLYTPGDASELCRAIASLNADPERRADLGERGRRRIGEAFSLEKMVAGVEQALARACGMPVSIAAYRRGA